MTSPFRVFISGRIRGCPNLSHFQEAVKYIESLGHIAVNPERLIEVFHGIPDDNMANSSIEEQQCNIRFWMREALRLLLDSDAIYFCPNMDSEGMKLERHIAEIMKLPVIQPAPKLGRCLWHSTEDACGQCEYFDGECRA